MRSEREHAEDLDLYLRLSEAGANILRIDAATLIYRMHGTNQSRAGRPQLKRFALDPARGRSASSRMMREL